MRGGRPTGCPLVKVLAASLSVIVSDMQCISLTMRMPCGSAAAVERHCVCDTIFEWLDGPGHSHVYVSVPRGTCAVEDSAVCGFATITACCS